MRIADIKPISDLNSIATAAQGAEPPREELVKLLKAGSQPYVIVIFRSMVLFGLELYLAAKSLGQVFIEVVECPDCHKLTEGDLLLKAAGLHYKAARENTKPSPFETRLLAARIYRSWIENRKACPPGGLHPKEAGTRKLSRQRLFLEAFGRAQRSLQRDYTLLLLPPKLQDAVRLKQLPEQFVEAVEKLPTTRKVQLADQLARGVPFTVLKEEFFGPSGQRRKSNLSAACAIQKCLSTIATEARGREECFSLRAHEYALAREVRDLLDRCLRVPPPEGSVDDQVLHGLEDLRKVRSMIRDDSNATGGDLGASGGTR